MAWCSCLWGLRGLWVMEMGARAGMSAQREYVFVDLSKCAFACVFECGDEMMIKCMPDLWPSSH